MLERARGEEPALSALGAGSFVARLERACSAYMKKLLERAIHVEAKPVRVAGAILVTRGAIREYATRVKAHSVISGERLDAVLLAPLETRRTSPRGAEQRPAEDPKPVEEPRAEEPEPPSLRAA